MKPQQWTECPPLSSEIPYNQTDLTGTTQGKLTVVGYACNWIVRCECGIYENRKSKALLNKSNDKDACAECRKASAKLLLSAPVVIRNHTPTKIGSCGKQTFKSEKACKAAIHNRLNKGSNCDKLRSYFCRDCRGYHMSSSFNNCSK